MYVGDEVCFNNAFSSFINSNVSLLWAENASKLRKEKATQKNNRREFPIFAGGPFKAILHVVDFDISTYFNNWRFKFKHKATL